MSVRQSTFAVADSAAPPAPGKSTAPLTDEQRAVVDAAEPVVKVNAVAGSGKTTTLLEFAARRPQTRILYLAYNRAVAAEVKAKAAVRGLSNLAVSTLHGLAYRYADGHRYELERDLSEWRLLERYVPARERSREQATLHAWALKDLINFYLNGSPTRLDHDLLSTYRAATEPTERVSELLEHHGEELVAQVRAVLSDMRSCKAPAVHDFYLKMFQFAKVRLPYEVILVDEAQDTSGVMLAIVERQSHAQRVWVGDAFQQIYGFRHAVNSLNRLHGASYGLTQTFRFGDGLARHIAQRMNDAYGLLGESPGFTMRGTTADIRWGQRYRRGKLPVTVIGRSNLMVFEAVLEQLSQGNAKLHFEGGYPGYAFLNPRVVGLLYLKDGRHGQIADPFIKQFGSFDDAKRFAKDTQNAGMSIMIDLVARHGKKLFDFDRLIKARIVEKPDAQFVFTTAHKAKGQEYPAVEMLDDDFITRTDLAKQIKTDEDINPRRLKEEINVYYVAATRARHAIKLAEF